jgi:MYXO-CTERM domain-containing protein
MPLGRSKVVAALAFLAAQASTATALATITFSVSSPKQGQVEGTSLGVDVFVSSTYAVQSVAAQVGAVTGNLAVPSSVGQPWTGTLAIGALPYGSQTLTITATDALNNTGSTTVTFFHHNPPLIQVTAPIDGSVARPTVTLAATCSDDTGCRYVPNGQTTLQPGFAVTLSTLGAQVATTNTNSLNQTVDLTAYAGQAVVLTFGATNADQETSAVSVQLFVDTSPRLAAVATVPGTILDFDPSRILFRKRDGSVVIRGRATQVDSIIGAAAFGSSYPPYGSLTSAGAVWYSSDPPSAACTNGSLSSWFWNGASATQFGPVPDCSGSPDQVVAGDWVLLPRTGVTPNALETVNVATGVHYMYLLPVAGGDVAGATVGADGSVFVLAGGNPDGLVYRDHGGTFTQLGTAGGVPTSAPVTDGVNLVFGVAVPGNGYRLNAFAISSGTQQILGTESVSPTPAMYAANGGWIAYMEPSGGVNQVWARSPAGVATMLSVYDTNSSVDALGASGEVMFLNGGDVDAGAAPGRYLRLPPALPEFISSPLGKAVVGCDGWYVKMGTTLFKVTGTDDAGVGCPALDAGIIGDGGSDGGMTADAGVSDSSQSPGPDATTLADGGPANGEDGGGGGPGSSGGSGSPGSSGGEGGGGSGSPGSSGGEGGGCAVASVAMAGSDSSWAVWLAAVAGLVLGRRRSRMSSCAVRLEREPAGEFGRDRSGVTPTAPGTRPFRAACRGGAGG